MKLSEAQKKAAAMELRLLKDLDAIREFKKSNPETIVAYSSDTGSILNALLEGDVLFLDAVREIEAKIENAKHYGHASCLAANADKMTIRDHFAAEAMQGLLAADYECKFSHQIMARMSYAQADAMVKERNFCLNLRNEVKANADNEPG